MPPQATARRIAAAVTLVPVSATLMFTVAADRVAVLPHEISSPGGAPSPEANAATLWIYSDPQCAACIRLHSEMETLVRPRDFGVTPVVRPPPAGNWGPWPRLILTGRDGAALGSIRGYRPPHVLRNWMAETLARDRS